MNFQWWWEHFSSSSLSGGGALPPTTTTWKSKMLAMADHDDPSLEPDWVSPEDALKALEAEDPSGALGALARVGRAVDAWVPSFYGVACDTALLASSFALGLVLLHMRHHAV
jgi:hypothetical protein